MGPCFVAGFTDFLFQCSEFSARPGFGFFTRNLSFGFALQTLRFLLRTACDFLFGACFGGGTCFGFLFCLRLNL